MAVLENISIDIVASDTEPSRSEAVIPGLRAAEHALPINKIIAVLSAESLTSTASLQNAALANKVLLLG